MPERRAGRKKAGALDKKRVTYITMGFVVLLLVFMALLAWGGRRRSPGIVLPESQTDSASVDGGGPDSQVNTVSIAPETVGSAVSTLTRPSSYSRTQTVETFWSGGSGQAVYQVYVNGGRTRLDTTLPDGSVRHTLAATDASGGTLAGVWYDDETEWKLLSGEDLTADIAGRMLTYETVRDLPPEEIALADYRRAFDEACIYVETRPNGAGYADRYWVSAGSGLLIAAERLSGGEVVYRFSAGEPDVSPQEEGVFLLPDGSVLGED